MKKYTIDVDAVRGYVDYLKKFKKNSLDNQSAISKKLADVHSTWDDVNYDKTDAAMKEIKSQLDKLFLSWDETVKSLNKMVQAYDDYLKRRH